MENEKYFMFLSEVDTYGVNVEYLKALMEEYPELSETEAKTVVMQWKFR